MHSPKTASADVATLLEHRSWVRDLARRLVADPGAADDLEQETWLRTLAAPPRSSATPRGWLATVLRHAAVDRHRRDARIGRSERASARREEVASTVDVVATAESHRRVVDAVLHLAEPLRTTILLRYFEGLPPREVSARLGVPVETVRTRTRRAIARMRSELDAATGERAAWVAALAPLAGGKAWTSGGAAASPALHAAAALTGGTAMGAKTFVAIGAAALVLGALIGGGTAATLFRASGADASESLAAEVRTLRTRLEAAEASRPPAHRAEPGDITRDEQDRKIAALESELADTRRRLDAMASAAKEPAASPQSGPRLAIDPQRMKDLSNEQAIAELTSHVGRAMVVAEKDVRRVDGEGLLASFASVLGRGLDADTRAQVLTLEGMAHRVLGNRTKALVDFREALSLAGPATERGRSARYQIAWSWQTWGEHRSAGEAFASLADERDASESDRSFHRRLAATNYADAGERAASQRQFRLLVEEFGASENAGTKELVEFARAALSKD